MVCANISSPSSWAGGSSDASGGSFRHSWASCMLEVILDDQPWESQPPPEWTNTHGIQWFLYMTANVEIKIHDSTCLNHGPPLTYFHVCISCLQLYLSSKISKERDNNIHMKIHVAPPELSADQCIAERISWFIDCQSVIKIAVTSLSKNVAVKLQITTEWITLSFQACRKTQLNSYKFKKAISRSVVACLFWDTVQK